MSEIWEKMGNPMPFERAMVPNRHIMENYGDLQPTAQSMKPTLWGPSENLSFSLLPKDLKPEKATGHNNVTSKELILADEAVKPGIKSIIKKKYYR